MSNKTVIFTDRSVKSVDLLLKDISKYPILSNDEEYSLWERMQQGSKAARERLINCNMRYVVTMAKRYLWSGIALEDLIMTGSVGLTLAADRFDATRGYRFLSYAVWWIDGELRKAVTEHWPYEQMTSLDAPIDPIDESGATLLDFIPSNCVDAPDWRLMRESEIAEAKEILSERYFNEVASLFEDALRMHNKGYALYDIAKKHHVSEDVVKSLLRDISRDLCHNIPMAA